MTRGAPGIGIRYAQDALEKLTYEPRPQVTRRNVDGSIQDH